MIQPNLKQLVLLTQAVLRAQEAQLEGWGARSSSPQLTKRLLPFATALLRSWFQDFKDRPSISCQPSRVSLLSSHSELPLLHSLPDPTSVCADLKGLQLRA